MKRPPCNGPDNLIIKRLFFLESAETITSKGELEKIDTPADVKEPKLYLKTSNF